MDTEILHRYIGSDLTPGQLQQLDMLGNLYTEWNARINVVSRRDIDNLYLHHVLHSLAIARFMGPLVDGTTMMDLGCGGGFPGIPLAIVYPHCRFHLIDRIAKKIRVAQAVAEAVALDNVTFQHGDVGECRSRFDYVVSRGVMPLGDMLPLVRRLINPVCHNQHANGLVCLKGGNLTEEIKDVREPVIEFPVTEFFGHEFFDTKKVVYVPLAKK